jgi:homopolymeric O-antigen transport system permease protein
MARSKSVTIITSGEQDRGLLPRDLLQFRGLFAALVGRDLKVRYKQTIVGVAWAVIQPAALTLVFTVFFGYLGRFPSDGLPYPLFALCGLLPWQLFARALNDGSMSVVTNSALVGKVYFPRLILPAAVVVSGLVDFAIAFLVLLGVMAYYGIALGGVVLLVPLMVVLILATSLGVALFLAALYVRYRDIHHVLPLLTMVWFFASPVFYPSSLVPEALRVFYGLNPMVGVIEGFRWALLGGAAPSWPMLAVSAAVVFFLLAGGLAYFNRAERTFADRL